MRSYTLKLLGLDKDTARDALNRIKNDPQKKQALEELSKYLDGSGFVDEFKKSLVSNMASLLKHREGSDEATIEEGLPEGLENITEKDLNDPKVQDKLLEAVMAQYYDTGRGYFNLGGKGVDRLAYNRSWGAMIGIPKNLFMALPLYYALCLTSVWPVKGLVAAAGIQALNQLTSADLYYKNQSQNDQSVTVAVQIDFQVNIVIGKGCAGNLFVGYSNKGRPL